MFFAYSSKFTFFNRNGSVNCAGRNVGSQKLWLLKMQQQLSPFWSAAPRLTWCNLFSAWLSLPTHETCISWAKQRFPLIIHLPLIETQHLHQNIVMLQTLLRMQGKNVDVRKPFQRRPCPLPDRMMITRYCSFRTLEPRAQNTPGTFSLSQGHANSAKLFFLTESQNHKLVSVLYTWLTRSQILHLEHQLHILLK